MNPDFSKEFQALGLEPRRRTETDAPQWLDDLEKRLKTIKQTHQLEHEVGAGSACLICAGNCPGLQLHFWRKICQNCKCRREDHDVPRDKSDLRFEILVAKKGTKGVLSHFEHPNERKQEESGYKDHNKNVQFDWIPPDTTNDLAADYMRKLPSSVLPISGTPGAKHREWKLEQQIPLHDILPFNRHKLPPKGQEWFEEYLLNVRNNVGVGKIHRILPIKQYLQRSEPYSQLQSAGSSGALKKDLKPGSETLNPQSSQKNLNDLQLSHQFQISVFPPPPPQHLLNQVGTQLNPPLPPGLAFLRGSAPRPIPLQLPSAFKKPIPRKEQTGDSIDDLHKTNNNAADDVSNPPRFQDPNSNRIKDIKHPHQKIMHHQYGLDSCPPIAILPSPDSSAIVLPEKTQSRTIIFPEPVRRPSVEEFQYVRNTNESTAIMCHNCTKEIPIGEVAVKTDQPGFYVSFHPQCFVCDICQELLVDLLYFHHKKKMYCGRHYAEIMEIPRCNACDELIFVDVYTEAEGKFYHIFHFCCLECDLALAGKNYLLVKEQALAGKNYLLVKEHAVCLPCYNKSYTKNCQTCKQPIQAVEKGIRFKDMDWHAVPDCFRCADCAKSLVGSRFTFQRENPFCSKDCVTSFISKLSLDD